jgi:hypothetical protein
MELYRKYESVYPIIFGLRVEFLEAHRRGGFAAKEKVAKAVEEMGKPPPKLVTPFGYARPRRRSDG